VKKLKEFGYDGIDWRVQTDYHIDPKDVEKEAKELKNICGDSGLDIVALATYLSLGQIEEIKSVLNGAAIMGCKRIRLAGCAYDGSRNYNDLCSETIEKLKMIENIFSGSQVKALLEIHPWTIHSSASGALNLVRHFDPKVIGVIAEPGNMIIEGRENWKMGFEILSHYLDHVHFKNNSWHYSEDKGWEWRRDYLNRGIVNWGEVMRALESVDYKGYLANENLHMVPTSTRGYVGERHDSLKGYEGFRSIDERLADITYLKSIQG
jgi:sugar phosphate isomerase/epimerase